MECVCGPDAWSDDGELMVSVPSEKQGVGHDAVPIGSVVNKVGDGVEVFKAEHFGWNAMAGLQDLLSYVAH